MLVVCNGVRVLLTFLTHAIVRERWWEVADSHTAARRLVLQSLNSSATGYAPRRVIFMVLGYRLVSDIAVRWVAVRIN